MEIVRNTWNVQNAFASLNERNDQISTSELIAKTGIGRLQVNSTVKKMDCVKKSVVGTIGRVGGAPSPNKYIRMFLPGSKCKYCHFVKSGTSGCILILSKQDLIVKTR